MEEPAVDEPSVFVICWLGSIVLALGAGAAAAVLAARGGDDESTAAIAVLVMVGTYVAAFALSLLAIVASRKRAWLRRVIGYRRQHALPAPRKGRKLPDGKS